MRKALIAVIVASALFAVGAFAASFTVQSEDIASGANGVGACASKVDIRFPEPVHDATTGLWTVSKVTATFYETDPTNAFDPVTPVNTCDNFDAGLAVKVGTGYQTLAAEADISGGVVEFTFASPVDVNQVTEASVVVDDFFLTP